MNTGKIHVYHLCIIVDHLCGQQVYINSSATAFAYPSCFPVVEVGLVTYQITKCRATELLFSSTSLRCLRVSLDFSSSSAFLRLSSSSCSSTSLFPCLSSPRQSLVFHSDHIFQHISSGHFVFYQKRASVYFLRSFVPAVLQLLYTSCSPGPHNACTHAARICVAREIQERHLKFSGNQVH